MRDDPYLHQRCHDQRVAMTRTVLVEIRKGRPSFAITKYLAHRLKWKCLGGLKGGVLMQAEARKAYHKMNAQ